MRVAWAGRVANGVVLTAVVVPSSYKGAIRRGVGAPAKFRVPVVHPPSRLKAFCQAPASVWLLRDRRYMRLPSLLHTAGCYETWGVFTQTHVAVVLSKPGDVPFLAILAAAMGLRIARRLRTGRRTRSLVTV